MTRTTTHLNQRFRQRFSVVTEGVMWSNTSPVRALFEVDSGCALVSIRTLSTRSMDCCEVSQRGQASSGNRANQSGLPL
jgi:hypothetical protein